MRLEPRLHLVVLRREPGFHIGAQDANQLIQFGAQFAELRLPLRVLLGELDLPFRILLGELRLHFGALLAEPLAVVQAEYVEIVPETRQVVFRGEGAFQHHPPRQVNQVVNLLRGVALPHHRLADII